MSNEHAETLNRLFEDGYLIMLQHAGYELDEQVTLIEDRGETKENPEWIIYTDSRELRPDELFLNEVKVYARVDWAQLLPSDQYKETFGMTSEPQSLQDWNQDLDNAYDEAGD